MTDIIEKVARAIYKVDGEKGWHLHEKFYMAAARAAIEAMREPTEEMRAAYWDDETVGYGADPSDHDMVWKAGIDAALGQSNPHTLQDQQQQPAAKAADDQPDGP